MSFNPKDAVDAVRDIAANAVEGLGHRGKRRPHHPRRHRWRGQRHRQDSIDIATHAVDRTKEVFTGKTDDEG